MQVGWVSPRASAARLIEPRRFASTNASTWPSSIRSDIDQIYGDRKTIGMAYVLVPTYDASTVPREGLTWRR